MADFYLNWSNWGLEVSGGRLREINPDGTDWIGEMRQRVAIAIKTHLGEVLLDTTRGLPWSEEILIKGPDLAQITSRTRAYLLTIEGVTGVRRLEIELDNATRIMTWTVDVETPAGVTGPFNVTVTF